MSLALYLMPGVDNYSVDGLISHEKELERFEDELLNVGAIDIGTNSTHLLVASVNTVLNTFSIEIAEKSTTRLGEKDPDNGNLTNLAMARVIETLKRFKELAESHKVKELVIAATSAVREAPNGMDFLFEVKEKLGLDVDLISGIEEARLIYLGVLSGMSFGDRPHLILDIGGGSTELILADGRDAQALTTTRIGAVRLQTDFIKEEPISLQRQEFLKTFIQGSLEPAVEKVLNRMGKDSKPLMVATSGTAIAIGALLSEEDSSFSSSSKLQGYRFSKDSLDQLLQNLLKMNLPQRKKLSSLNDRRAEIIVPGAMILQASMKMLKAKEIVLSERALREGLIFDWMLRKGLFKDRFSFQSSIRQRTVLHQVKRFSVDIKRAEYVARHALTIYDKTKGILHDDNGDGRELLWAASMLHLCGQHINLTAYHKHSWYLIRHGDLLGYSHPEHLMVAAIARYHRRSLPKKKHDEWQSLSKSNYKRLVFEMSLILRLASSLDKRPEPAIDAIEVIYNESRVEINLLTEKSTSDIELERWSFNDALKIVCEAKGINISLR